MSTAAERTIEAERAVLGAILLENDLYKQASESLKPDDFSRDSHRRIYLGMADLAESLRPIDPITLSEELDRNRELETIGGHAYISGLLDGAVPENIGEHIRIVRRASHRIKLIACVESARMRAEKGDSVEAIVNDTDANLRLLEDAGTSAIRCSADLPDVFSLAAPDISYVVPEIVPHGSITLITGNPGCGKTWLAMKMAVSIALGSEVFGLACDRAPVLILDRENPFSLVRQRLWTLAGGPVPGLKIWGGWLPQPAPLIGDSLLLKIAASEKLVMFVDSLVRFHVADEDDASEMRVVMAHTRRLADVGATVILLHHKPKSEEILYRGSSDILAAVDQAFVLERREPCMLRLRCFKSRFCEERTFDITTDFSTGRFERSVLEKN